ncbi:MAG: major capsid protein [Candidatus Bathyarchaeota archaeon]|nr:major capsid protein [Candidatus Bathyarchaeota archaeon]
MSLFDYDSIKNHPSRSGFDMSFHRPFTAKCGELLPVVCKFTLPGDKWHLGHQHFTRTQPVNTAAFMRTREYFDWYFIPLRLLNKNIAQALMQMQNNPVQSFDLFTPKQITTDIPYVPLMSASDMSSFQFSLSRLLLHSYLDSSDTWNPALNQFGFYKGALSVKLLQYLDYGNFISQYDLDFLKAHGGGGLNYYYSSDEHFSLVASPDLNFNVNILPLLAYQKVYADFFRFTQWEKNNPTTYNCDYYSGGNFINFEKAKINKFWQEDNFLTLRYCNWPKDMFMGIMPDQQLGDVATITSSDVNANLVQLKVNTQGGLIDSNYNVIGSSTVDGSLSLSPVGVPAGETITNRPLGLDTSEIGSTFSIIQLRVAEALQKWKEVSQCADQDYRSQIYAHFGVKLSAALSDKCVYIGGSATNLNINEIENQNLVPGNLATIAGKGIGTGQSSFSFSCNEHGILLCVYHVQPILNHTITGQSSTLLMTNTSDYPIPEFDKIGLQSIHIFNYTNTPKYDFLASRFPMGYLPRFYDFKMSCDTISGAFRTTLKDWVVTLDPDYMATWFENSVSTTTRSVLNYNFFKVHPGITDSVFAVKADSSVDTDPFLVNSFFDIKVTRNLDYDGMPY